MSVGDLLIGYLLTRQAAIALDRLGCQRRRQRLLRRQARGGTVLRSSVLPELTARRAILARTDNALMDIADGAF